MTIKHELIIDPALLLPENSKEAQDAKKASIKSIADRLRANAWQLARWPLVKNMTWDRIQIHLPRSYLAKDGEDVRAIHQGSDINEFIYQHYLEPVDLKTNTWVNFVHADNVVAKRYLGFFYSLYFQTGYDRTERLLVVLPAGMNS